MKSVLSTLCLTALLFIAGCGASANEQEAKRELDMGMAAQSRGDKEKALDHFDRSIALHPTADAYGLRAFSQPTDELFFKDIDQSLAMEPDNEELKGARQDREKFIAELKAINGN